MILGLVRHGCTDWNRSGRLQGQNDIELNDEGRRQARALGRRLRGEGWELIVSSDLKRARETAEIIAEEAGISTVLLDKRLRERTHGRLDGTTLEERIALWGADWKSLDHGVESDGQLFARGNDCVEELLANYEGRRVLAVSHGAFIGVLLNGLLEQMPEGLLQNTALSVIERHSGAWRCLLYNCTRHLTE